MTQFQPTPVELGADDVAATTTTTAATTAATVDKTTKTLSSLTRSADGNFRDKVILYFLTFFLCVTGR